MVPMRLKLPEVEPPKFDGNVIKWNIFWDHFYSKIHTNDGLRKTDKFQYLVSLLQGRARMAIEYLQRNDEMYEKAIDILMERFGSEKLLHQAVY